MAPPKTDDELLDLIAKLRTQLTDLQLDTWTRSDLFLANWIHFGGYDVKKAEDGLRKSIKWRQEMNIDKVMQEAFQPEFHTFIPYDLPGFDNEGWPIMVCRFGSWDLKALLDRGYTTDEVSRYLYRLTEGLEEQLKDAYASKMAAPHDKPILSHGGVAIYDFSGLTWAQYASISCPKIVANFIRAAEAYYPRYGYRYYIVNVTGIVPTALRVLSTLFGGKTLSQMKLLGGDKKEWINEFAKYMNVDKLPVEFHSRR